MNQCVPSSELDQDYHQTLPPPPPHHSPTLRPHFNSNSLGPYVPSLDYEVAELTWENGQLAMHGLGPPRLPNKSLAAFSSGWEKQPSPAAGGTLESIVNQAAATATTTTQSAAQNDCSNGGDDLVQVNPPATTSSLALTMDALVPCSKGIGNDLTEPSVHVPGINTCGTLVGSCSGAGVDARLQRVNAAAACASAQEWSSRADRSVSGSGRCGRNSRLLKIDTCDRELGTAGTSFGSPENTSSAAKECSKTVDEHESPCQSRNEKAGIGEDKKKGNGKSSVSTTKRSRAAAIHNQSERKRRDKINQRMKTLQKLVPNSSKTDKASMLDEVIEYLKHLQAQVNVMSRINMSPMMLPLALQQQLQLPMMAPMGIGMSMGMGLGMGMGVMDLNSIARTNIAGIQPPVLPPAAYMPATTAWDGLGDRVAASAMPDPLAAFLASQSQPMTMDKMATLYPQF